MKLFISLFLAAFLTAGCVLPRLGLKTIKYDETVRQPVSENVHIHIFSDRKDIPFKFKVIGLVKASPPKAERDFGHDPIIYLKKQAREIGGKALLNLKSKKGYIWSAEVIVETES